MAKRSRARKALRFLAASALVVALLAAVGAFVSYRVALRSLARTTGDVVLAGLSAPAEATRDARGVVRIHADNPE